MRVRTRYRVDTSDVDRELTRLQDGLGTTDALRLDAVLELLFLRTQAAVHWDTGSLWNSGRTFHRRVGDMWYGAIAYGGSSPGAINDPVDYARYEQARGGTHDFMRSLYGGEDYLDPLMGWLKGKTF